MLHKYDTMKEYIMNLEQKDLSSERKKKEILCKSRPTQRSNIQYYKMHLLWLLQEIY